MDQLSSQVSDLRSFLEPAVPPATGSPAAFVSPRDGAAYSSSGGGGPLRASASSTAQTRQTRELSAPGDNSAPQTPAKRRATEDFDGDDADGAASSKLPKSKRNRYISIACNECKRRKIKCNGQVPCQRCGHLNLQCLYAPNCCSNNFKDSDEFRQVTDQVSHLQSQVDTLFSNIDSLRQEALRLAPIHERILPPPSATVTPSPSTPSLPSLPKPLPAFRVPPSFSGPTSIAFTVDVAKSTLHNMGYTSAGDGNDDGNFQPEQTPRTSPTFQLPPQSPAQTSPHPLWEYGRDEVIRLCRLYEEEVGVMYPVISIRNVIDHAINLTSSMESVRRNGQIPPHGPDFDVSDPRTLLLIIIMCCALAVEEHGNSAKADRLYDVIQPIIDRQLMAEPAEVARLPFLALVGGYRFLSNDEVLAWRVMGHVARHCLELGLHRREGLERISNLEDRRNALHTFWSAYVLDRRWSFSTGLPFVLHDDKIDPKLPYPERHPFLEAMISYSKLAAKIWMLVDYFEPAVIRELKPGDFEDLDRQIHEWYDSIPNEVKTDPSDKNWIPILPPTADSIHRLRIWTRLRLNQIRIWLYTPVLHSAISIVENIALAERAVDLAKETIRCLAQLNNTTNLYRRIQIFYHQFLTSSIAVLFLASTHAPLRFSANCRDEFYIALELVKDMSGRSWVSQRLWQTIRSLKEYAPRLGLEDNVRNGELISPHLNTAHIHSAGHSSASASASQSPAPGLTAPFTGEAGQTGNGGPRYPSTPSASQARQKAAEDQSNGLRLRTEMSRIFEYMGAKVGPDIPHMSESMHDHTMSTSLPGPNDGAYGNMHNNYMADESVYQHLKNIF